MADPLPLTALLSRALVSIGRAFAASSPGAPVRPDLVLWSHLLRVLPDDGLAVGDLHRAARVSKRAATSIAKGAGRAGFATIEQRVLRPTAAGAALRDVWGPLVEEVEASWTRARDAATVGDLRAALVDAVTGLELELAHYPVGYGPADVSMTGAGGVDWRPVRRTDAVGAARLPLHALLSQVLVALAIDYEGRGVGPLAYVANVFRLVGTDPVPLANFPRFAGLTGSGASALERHLLVTVAGTPPMVRLTPRGASWRASYAATSAAVESRLAGAAAVRAALQSIDPGLDPALPHFPMVVFTGTGFGERSEALT